jgi:phosphate starvation-inducible protein PhoH and related proteins
MLQTAQRRLSKKQKRILRQQGATEVGQKLNFNLRKIDPLTDNQKLTFDYYNQGKNLLLHGIAGTGKSFIAIYLALKQVLESNGLYKKVYIVRSVVPTREIGFMPGGDKQKIKVYEGPYYSICEELFDRGDAYEYLKNKNVVEFISTSFIRGITLNDSIIIVDEIQNMDWGELSSIITRIGKNCRVVFCGDFRQSDFRFRERESRNDINKFMQVIKNMKSDFEFVEFQIPDIVRSKIVKNFIISVNNLGYD